MLYSIGYQHLTVNALVDILREKGVTHLVDVRSKPFSRLKGFNKNQLQRSLTEAGIIYLWAGDRLGGLAPISEEAIAWLAEWQKDKTACIMCMESDPDRCHRKQEIARRLENHGVSVSHIR